MKSRTDFNPFAERNAAHIRVRYTFKKITSARREYDYEQEYDEQRVWGGCESPSEYEGALMGVLTRNLPRTHPRIQRRWRTYSLRAMMLMVTCLAMLLGWQVCWWRQAKAARIQVERMGGQIRTKASDGTWLDQLPDFCRPPRSVMEVYFLGPHVGDEQVDDLADALTKLQDVEFVSFVETSLTATGEATLRERLPHVVIRRTFPVLTPESYTQ
jgi:hypothetical protein